MNGVQGSFCWYDLLTTDTPAAARFYGAVIGWTAVSAPHSPIPYWVLQAGQDRAAGLMKLPAELARAGVPSHWMGYVAVDDVDAQCAAAVRLGGGVEHGPADIAGMGRFATVRDANGAVLVLFQGMSPLAARRPGFVAWRELYADDLDAAWAFYGALFGWTKTAAIDMGPAGVYQLFAHGGADIGGMMARPPGVPASVWMYYIEVDAMAAAAERVRLAGGQVVIAPHQVPGGSWVLQGRDPQGGAFALTSAAA